MPAQVWSVSSLGNTLGTPMLSERIRFSAYGRMRFGQFVKIESKFGPNRTDTMFFKKVGKVSQKGRVHAEGEPIQEAALTFFSDSVVVVEISNSISFTDRVEELAKLSIRAAIIQRLRDDAADVLDNTYAAKFQASDVVYTPTGAVQAPTFTVSTTGSAGASAPRNTTIDDVKNIADLLKATYKAPAYDAEGRYVWLGGSQSLRGIKDSRDAMDFAKHGQPERFFYGEAGMNYGVRFVEENNILSNSLGSAGNLGEAIVFGDDPVIEIIAKPLQLQAKVGVWERERGIRYVVWLGVARTWSFSQDSQVRSLHVSST